MWHSRLIDFFLVTGCCTLHSELLSRQRSNRQLSLEVHWSLRGTLSMSHYFNLLISPRLRWTRSGERGATITISADGLLCVCWCGSFNWCQYWQCISVAGCWPLCYWTDAFDRHFRRVCRCFRLFVIVVLLISFQTVATCIVVHALSRIYEIRTFCLWPWILRWFCIS